MAQPTNHPGPPPKKETPPNWRAAPPRQVKTRRRLERDVPTTAGVDGLLQSGPGRPGVSARQERRRVALGALLCGVALGALLLAGGLWLFGRLRPAPALPVLQSVQPPQGEAGYAATDVAEKLSPSVVSIAVYDKDALTPSGSGSGVVLSQDGYIATNLHVIDGAARIRVTLHTGKGYTATVVGVAPKNDLAVIKIRAWDLIPAELADSDTVRQGQQVYVVGNAAGTLPGSITQGVISGVGRRMPVLAATGETVRMTLLQTDAAINPGNSGGALANSHGQVVGISIGKIDGSDMENIGFAIPVNTALPVLQGLIEQRQQLPAAMLGAGLVELNETTGPTQNLPAQGLYIVEINSESHLNRLQVFPGDVLLAADGVVLHTTDDLLGLLEQCLPGETLPLTVWLAETGEICELVVELYGA